MGRFFFAALLAAALWFCRMPPAQPVFFSMLFPQLAQMICGCPEAEDGAHCACCGEAVLL